MKYSIHNIIEGKPEKRLGPYGVEYWQNGKKLIWDGDGSILIHHGRKRLRT